MEATDSNQLISIYYPRYDPVEGHKRFTVLIILYRSQICPFWMRMIASKDNNQRINRVQEWWFFYINFCTFHLQWYHCIPHFEAEAWGDLEMIYLIMRWRKLYVYKKRVSFMFHLLNMVGFLPWDIHTGRFFKFGFILISRWII